MSAARGPAVRTAWRRSSARPGALGHPSRWEGFWYSSGSPTRLGVFRALFAACLVLEVETGLEMNVFALPGGYHLPYASFVPAVPEAAYRALHLGQLPFIALLAVGILARTSCAVLLAMQGWLFFADRLEFRNHPWFFLLVLLLLALSACGEGFSLRGRLRGWRGSAPIRAVPLTAQRLLQVQVSLVYLFAGLHKLNASFLGGHVLAHHLSVGLGSGLSGRVLRSVVGEPTLGSWISHLSEPGRLVALSVASAALELFLAFALWSRRTRPVAIAAGLAFHLGIGFTMNVFAFSLVMMSSYVLFLEEPDAAGRAPAPAAGWASGRGRGAAAALACAYGSTRSTARRCR